MAVIFHLDLDSFFVSAERLMRPELRGKCVAVGGDGKRGVISSCSYEARKFGVRSAMPGMQAIKLCPQLIFVPVNFELYQKLSGQVFDILSRFTPTYEAVSIDEAYLDMTGTTEIFGTPREAAEKIRAAILKETGLIASIGIASNRLVAKVTSDFCKPNGVHQVAEGGEAAFLAPLSVRTLPGVGKVSEASLNQKGIFRVSDLQKFALATLERDFGNYGTYLFDLAWGKGSTAFHEEGKSRSMSRESTFEDDIYDRKALKHELWKMCAELGASVRSSEYFEGQDHARTVKLKLRFPPFETISRSRVLSAPARLDSEIYDVAEKLLDEAWDGARPIRLIGAGVVMGDGVHQMGLFDDRQDHEKREKIDTLKDQLREKFGAGALKTGRDFEP